jgi:arsenite/tail-anchored protein-transporting ATPase
LKPSVDEILVSRQVVLVTGKGGVGKSAVSASLAFRARDLGLRPILFECDAPARPSILPNGRLSSDELEEISPGILGINQKSEDAIRDYAATTLPSRTVVDLLFENRVARLFLKAAPSVTEMAVVGRVAYLAEKHGAEGPVIVDLHATGHALNLLRAPGGIMKVLRAGVLYDRARHIEELLADPVRTAFVTVALPEELPVTELIELREKLVELRAPLGPTIVNGTFEDPAPAVADTVLDAIPQDGPAGRAVEDLRALRAWARRAAREEARLAQALDGEALVRVPWMFDDGTPLAPRIAASFAPSQASRRSA